MLSLVNVMENINCYDLMLTKLTPAPASQPVENFTSTGSEDGTFIFLSFRLQKCISINQSFFIMAKLKGHFIRILFNM